VSASIRTGSRFKRFLCFVLIGVRCFRVHRVEIHWHSRTEVNHEKPQDNRCPGRDSNRAWPERRFHISRFAGSSSQMDGATNSLRGAAAREIRWRWSELRALQGTLSSGIATQHTSSFCLYNFHFNIILPSTRISSK
jgi:hypothetical protein